MSWTERLNEGLPRVRLGATVVDILEWSHVDRPVRCPPHRHSYFVVCRVEAGEGEFTAAERCHRVGPRDLLVVRPGVRHGIVGGEGFRASWVSFELPAGVAADDEQGVLLQGFAASDSTVVRDSGQPWALWEMLKEAARGPRTPGQRATLSTLGAALLVSVACAAGGDVAARPRSQAMPGVGCEAAAATAAPTAVAAAWGSEGSGSGPDRAGGHVPGRHLRAVRMAVRYIKDNLDRPLRVEELAKQVDVSVRQLTRLFATLVGEPPASYVERVRLEHAAVLLAQTQTPIKRIAAEVGYPDVPTFTRAFARQHQSPPGRFRRANLDGARAENQPY